MFKASLSSNGFIFRLLKQFLNFLLICRQKIWPYFAFDRRLGPVTGPVPYQFRNVPCKHLDRFLSKGMPHWVPFAQTPLGYVSWEKAG